MPKVTIEYDLPREQDAVEAALLGQEAIETLKQLRTWLEREHARKGQAPGENTYRAGLGAVRDWFAEHEAPRQFSDDSGSTDDL